MGIILAMPSLDNAKKIAEKLGARGYPPDTVCSLGSQVLTSASNEGCGLVVCTAKLKDMNYVELLENLPQFYEVLVMSSDPEIDTSSGCVTLLQIPFRNLDLLQSVGELVKKAQQRYKREKTSVQRRTPEQQLMIDEAKKVLMETEGFDEPEAFRYIQKRSMDSGRSMHDSAKMILMLYGRE